MKILVISLLRLGDVILMTPALKGLREKFPHAQLDVLINHECRAVSTLIPYVDQWIHWPREFLQHGLGEVDQSMLASFTEAHRFLTDLKDQRYDAVYNLTHNRLSGWIAGLIESPVQAGLEFNDQGRALISSEWFHHLNQLDLLPSSANFHYADIFYGGCALGSSWHPIALSETDRGIEEARAFIGDEPLILVQALTSDSKKTWPLESWAQSLRLLRVFHPQARIVLVGAPAERIALSRLQRQLETLKSPVQLALISLEGLLSLCHHADLLITGDTSAMHIASSTPCRIVQLSIGSSDFHKTGVYSADNLILQAKEPCAPCAHSGLCSRATHACAERLVPECVALAASKLLQNDFHQIKILAEQYRDDVGFYRTQWSDWGFWQAEALIEPFNRNTVAHWVQRLSWQIYMSRGNASPPIHQWASQLSRTLTHLFPRQSRADWRFVLGDLERSVQSTDASTTPNPQVQVFERQIIRVLREEWERS